MVFITQRLKRGPACGISLHSAEFLYIPRTRKAASVQWGFCGQENSEIPLCQKLNKTPWQTMVFFREYKETCFIGNPWNMYGLTKKSLALW